MFLTAKRLRHVGLSAGCCIACRKDDQGNAKRLDEGTYIHNTTGLHDGHQQINDVHPSVSNFERSFSFAVIEYGWGRLLSDILKVAHKCL